MSVYAATTTLILDELVRDNGQPPIGVILVILTLAVVVWDLLPVAGLRFAELRTEDVFKVFVAAWGA